MFFFITFAAFFDLSFICVFIELLATKPTFFLTRLDLVIFQILTLFFFIFISFFATKPTALFGTSVWEAASLTFDTRSASSPIPNFEDRETNNNAEKEYFLRSWFYQNGAN